MKAYFINLFKYHSWANKKILDQIKNLYLHDETINNVLSHLLLGEKIWLQRLKSEKYDNNFWQKINPAGCILLTEQNEKQIGEYLSSLSENDFERKVTYTNSLGIEYINTIEEILTHLSHHSAYHRGQIAKEMRKLGNEPVNTDYIVYLRK